MNMLVYRGKKKKKNFRNILILHIIILFMTSCYFNSLRDHPESYHSFMWHHLFKHIDIDPNNVNILDGNAENLIKECVKFEEKIKNVGGIELFIGGWF